MHAQRCFFLKRFSLLWKACRWCCWKCWNTLRLSFSVIHWPLELLKGWTGGFCAKFHQDRDVRRISQNAQKVGTPDSPPRVGAQGGYALGGRGLFKIVPDWAFKADGFIVIFMHLALPIIHNICKVNQPSHSIQAVRWCVGARLTAAHKKEPRQLPS